MVGDDVIIGPHAHVGEFSTARSHTVIGPRAGVGFNYSGSTWPARRQPTGHAEQLNLPAYADASAPEVAIRGRPAAWGRPRERGPTSSAHSFKL
ncbi:hypothetical protein [Streptomyces sp. MZ04]|uniref:hypothetical protein n=1 Tax=Streptomyces sp. MZ04 TaxID=2559236 RepID=UPI001FD7E482|nr:hypothetical protein [Streptomyces sp. MZ04]